MSPVTALDKRMAKDERRAQLLEAAQSVFVASGYHAAAMDEIADRAGVSKPVLYQHFPSKLELYITLVDFYIDELIEKVRQALKSTTDNRKRVQATIAAYFDFVDSDGEAFRLLFENDLTSQPEVRERLERLNTECAIAIGQVIAEDTSLGKEASELLAVALIGNAQIAARYWRENFSHMPSKVASDMIANLTWRGISGFPLEHKSEG